MSPAARWTTRWRDLVTRETTGGALLVGAALVAIVWANTPWRATYDTIVNAVPGGAALHGVHLDLTLGEWAADGLLAIFFFVVGLELKQEIVAGSLRDPRRAAVPVLAAVGGMIVPAIVFVISVHVGGDASGQHGWAIPTATDIAFALAVLAIFGRGLPAAVRTFLLTLAVVDDLLAICVIAIVYTESVSFVPLVGGLVCVAAFAWVVRWRRPPWWLLAVLGVLAWVLVHVSGVHATVAGVLLGFVVPVRALHREHTGRAERYEHAWRPVSAGVALPLFAFFAAGVTVVGGDGPLSVLRQPVAFAVMLGLVVGKPLGVMGVTWLAVRLTPLRLAPGLDVRDMLPVGALAGIGFTVALLVTELSFGEAPGDGTTHLGAAKAAVLVGSVISAVLSAVLLRRDARAHARAAGAITRDGHAGGASVAG